MIDTSKYIEEAINFLNNQDVEDLNYQFMYQTNYFNSQDYNYTLYNIENNLNILYEKSRVLQDVIKYTREYIKQNVYEITDECRSILDAIEDNVDSLKQNNYININVPFLQSTGSYVDRDGKKLEKNAIYDAAITLSGTDKEKLRIKKITQKNNFKPYKENLSNLIQDKEYRSFYMLDAPVTDGLKEQITVEFETENIINQLNIIASNCKISDMKYIDATGTTDYINDHSNVIQSPRKTKSIEFITTTDSYKKIVYYIDQARVKANFWDSIMEHEYKKTSTGTGTLTQSQIDEMAGITAFKKEYDDYVKQVEEWIKKRQAVVDANIANGYTDSVPKIDFIVAPSSISGDTSLNIETKETTTDTKSSVIIDVPVVTPNVFPDIENYRTQTYTSNSSLVDKTGRSVDFFTTLADPKTYAPSYQYK